MRKTGSSNTHITIRYGNIFLSIRAALNALIAMWSGLPHAGWAQPPTWNNASISQCESTSKRTFVSPLDSIISHCIQTSEWSTALAFFIFCSVVALSNASLRPRSYKFHLPRLTIKWKKVFPDIVTATSFGSRGHPNHAKFKFFWTNDT